MPTWAQLISPACFAVLLLLARWRGGRRPSLWQHEGRRWERQCGPDGAAPPTNRRQRHAHQRQARRRRI